MPTAIEAADAFRAELLASDRQAMARLIRAYRGIQVRLEGNIEALIAKAADGELRVGELVRLERYKALLSQVEDELAGYAGIVRESVNGAASSGIARGELHARQLLSVITSGDIEIAARFNVLPKAAIESLLGFLAPDSALYERIGMLAPATRDVVAETIRDGVALGRGPRQLANAIDGALGQGLVSALRMTRTVQLYSYREANRASYIANGDILEGWVWHAQLDGVTCVSCIAQHGTIHPLDERLNDHYNGRCAMIPIVKGFPPVVEGSGQEWFEGLSEEKQRSIMGKGRHDAWREGKFEFSQLSRERHDDVYGMMRQEAALKDLVNESE